MSIEKRRQVYKKTNGRCAYCNMRLTLQKLRGGKGSRFMTIDYIIPKSKGGESILENYQPLCARCNKVKGNQTEEEMEIRKYMVNLISR